MNYRCSPTVSGLCHSCDARSLSLIATGFRDQVDGFRCLAFVEHVRCGLTSHKARKGTVWHFGGKRYNMHSRIGGFTVSGPTLDGVSQAKSRLKSFFETVGIIAGVVFVYYLLLYWGMWRGGRWLYHVYQNHQIAEVAHPPPVPSVPNNAPSSTTEIFIRGVAGAIVAGIVGAITALIKRRLDMRRLVAKYDIFVVGVRKLRHALESNSTGASLEIRKHSAGILNLWEKEDFSKLRRYVSPGRIYRLIELLAVVELIAELAKGSGSENRTSIPTDLIQHVVGFKLTETRSDIVLGIRSIALDQDDFILGLVGKSASGGGEGAKD